MPGIYSSIACNLDADILGASIPLFQEEMVEAIEWSFDALYHVKEIPSWFNELLHAYSREERLVGHGVFFSLFSGKWSTDQGKWLAHLKKTSTEFRFDHITEHFGFMTGKDFHAGAPLNVPYSPVTLAIGRDRLKRIYEACRCPVGLENLAFSYSLEEVKRHGEFLDRLIEPVNGFIILDLHNLYCQLHNFNIGFENIIKLYPTERVREIHISGGSWDHTGTDDKKRIRRDTHDDAVPDEVYELLDITITRCPNLKFVVLEQLGTGLKTDESRRQFYNDFKTMKQIVAQHNDKASNNYLNSFLPASVFVNDKVAEDQTLHDQQTALSFILENAADVREAMNHLKNSSLANTEWKVEQWEPCMIETAMKIAQKWKS